MQGATKPASAVRLFTSQFNSTKCAAADILRRRAYLQQGEGFIEHEMPS
jgi:hypothetical protein